MSMMLKTLLSALLFHVLLSSVADGQLDTIDDIESHGFIVVDLIDGLDSPGIKSIRWKLQTAEVERQMLEKQIRELHERYRASAEQQQAMREKLMQSRIAGSIESKLAEVLNRTASAEDQLAALDAERKSLAMRMDYEQEKRHTELNIAEKQRELIQQMLDVKRMELARTKKMVNNGNISAHELAEIQTQIKQMEIEALASEANLKNKSDSTQEIKVALASIEERRNQLQVQLKSLEHQRKLIQESQATAVSEPRLQFDQQLALKLIETSSLRLLELKMEAIRLQALLTMVEQNAGSTGSDKPDK